MYWFHKTSFPEVAHRVGYSWIRIQLNQLGNQEFMDGAERNRKEAENGHNLCLPSAHFQLCAGRVCCCDKATFGQKKVDSSRTKTRKGVEDCSPAALRQKIFWPFFLWSMTNSCSLDDRMESSPGFPLTNLQLHHNVYTVQLWPHKCSVDWWEWSYKSSPLPERIQL